MPPALKSFVGNAPRSLAGRDELEEIRRFARMQNEANPTNLLPHVWVFALQREGLLLKRRDHLRTWETLHRQTVAGRRQHAAQRKDIEDRLRVVVAIIKRLKPVVWDR